MYAGGWQPLRSHPVTPIRILAVAVVALCLAACGSSGTPADGSDGAAVAACRGVLAEISEAKRLATTVRADGPGYLVSAWRDGRAEGDPDYLCRVVRDENAERGVAVLNVHGQDGSGAYRSTLDIDFDRH